VDALVASGLSEEHQWLVSSGVPRNQVRRFERIQAKDGAKDSVRCKSCDVVVSAGGRSGGSIARRLASHIDNDKHIRTIQAKQAMGIRDFFGGPVDASHGVAASGDIQSPEYRAAVMAVLGSTTKICEGLTERSSVSFRFGDVEVIVDPTTFVEEEGDDWVGMNGYLELPREHAHIRSTACCKTPHRVPFDPDSELPRVCTDCRQLCVNTKGTFYKRLRREAEAMLAGRGRGVRTESQAGGHATHSEHAKFSAQKSIRIKQLCDSLVWYKSKAARSLVNSLSKRNTVKVPTSAVHRHEI
jgi:hypothetical protein